MITRIRQSFSEADKACPSMETSSVLSGVEIIQGNIFFLFSYEQFLNSSTLDTVNLLFIYAECMPRSTFQTP